MKVELLSPAGNLEKLKIALHYGADAVYGGVSQFSLRSRSGKEFDYESFVEGVRLAKSMGKKIYVTINGFPFNSQIELMRAHIEKMATLEVNGFIVATPGVIKLAREIAPHIHIHLSTQANVLNILDAEIFYNMGVKRIVCAREATLNDIKEIKKHIPELELEMFVHGSMCFAFSGRCLISSLQNGRVPNRGSCANDCRFEYEYYIENKDGELERFENKTMYVKNKDSNTMMRIQEEAGIGSYIFNAKDLNLSAHIKEILDSAAIDSLKIEGRTKSAYYTAITTRTYRVAIDDYYAGVQDTSFYQRELDTLKNRGFTDGYIIHRPYEKNDQNNASALSEGSYQVCAQVDESGNFAFCKHSIFLNIPKQIIAPLNVKIPIVKNDIGEIYEENGQYFVKFFKIMLTNGKEVDEIHSGNTNAFMMPSTLPAFTFLREKNA